MSPARKEPDLSTYSGRFGNQFRNLREAAELTVDEAVERINKFNDTERGGATRTKVYDWEQSRSTPHADLYPAIAKALKVKTVHDLLPVK